MATYRKVPARIITRDYVGIPTATSERYRRSAERELIKLEGQVLRGELDQGVRRVSLGDDVFVEAIVCYGIKQAIVTIGGNPGERLVEEQCYCCSPCLAAGVILRIHDPSFKEDEDYMADIALCQAAATGEPKKITVYDEHTSGGIRSFKERVIVRQGHAGVEIFDVPFADYQNHQIGDNVLVLVQPLYEFAPACLDFIPACGNVVGEYSPCINKGLVAAEAVLNTRMLITTAWINSTGNSCQILADKQVWTNDPEFPGEDRTKRYPFRILPIRIESCL